MSKTLSPFIPGCYLLPQEGGMRVPGLIVLSEELLQQEGLEKSLEQVRHVAHLPGIVGYSIAMPDIHWGYGFPIGGVAATDATSGVISPGGVGYDINCGVRLATLDLPYHTLKPTVQEKLLDALFTSIPSGVGHAHKGKGLTEEEYHQLLLLGASWSVEHGYGFLEDIAHTESNGCLKGADPSLISSTAKNRGRHQLGTIGSGNHFVEVGFIEEIFLPEVATAWNLQKEHMYILIHSGSRGFGHQVCQEALETFYRQGYAAGLPDPQLVAAPIQSPAGRHYLATMAAAANYAFNNRQQILHHVRTACARVLGIPPAHVRQLYDVCHNIAKFETHVVEGKKCALCVHRKGATRAFGPGAPELPPLFQKTGQPVLVPGDMGRASYILVGRGNPLTWCSCCHGAGRAHSRHQALAQWRGGQPVAYMKQQGVLVRATSTRTISEEMPDAYKDVDQVVKAVDPLLAQRVARLRPRLVLKG